MRTRFIFDVFCALQHFVFVSFVAAVAVVCDGVVVADAARAFEL